MSVSSAAGFGARFALAAVLALPLTSLIGRDDVPVTLVAVLGAVAGVSLLNVGWGALAAAALLPLAKWLHMVAGGSLTATAVSEALSLAFAVAALVRVPPQSLDAPSWLRWPATVLGLAVITSAAVDLTSLAGVRPGQPFLSDLWSHITVTYWTEEAGNWFVVHESIRWLTVLAVAVAVERALTGEATLARVVTWTWLSAAAVATTFTVVRIVEIVAAREATPLASLLLLLTTVRLSVLHPDQNAAGSIFALLLFAVVVIGRRRRVWLWAGPACLLLVGFVFAQSRAAIGALSLVALGYAVVRRRRMGARIAPVLAVGAVLVVIVGAWMMMSRSHIGVREALAVRVDLARTAVAMVVRYPEWGVGLGDYARTSRRFWPVERLASQGFGQGGENAHNNFLQIAAELGLPAAAAFVWLVLPVALTVWRRSVADSPEHEGLALGLSVFLISALFGHPLLIPEVAIMFFFGLGLTAAHTPTRRTGALPVTLAATATVVYLMSLAWRVRG
jgi:hypothetical protein